MFASVLSCGPLILGSVSPSVLFGGPSQDESSHIFFLPCATAKVVGTHDTVVKIIMEPGMALKNAEHVMKMYDLELPFSSSLRHHVMPSPLCPASEWNRSKNLLEHQHLGHML